MSALDIVPPVQRRGIFTTGDATSLLRGLRTTTGLMAVLGTVQIQVAVAQSADASVTVMPDSSTVVKQFASVPSLAPTLTPAQKRALFKQKTKHVVVLFREGRSFDHRFGTFPAVNGLFNGKAPNTDKPGFVQKIVNTDGSVGTISPFLIPQMVTAVNGTTVPLHTSDLGDVDHGHTGIAVGIDVDPSPNMSRNDRFAIDEKSTIDASGALVSKTTLLPATTRPTLAQKQTAEPVMARLDCNTVPFLWQYADRFALMDDFHMTVDGPSTPNAIAMIAGQGGETRYVERPNQVANEPVPGDLGPFPGSNLDKSAVKQTFNPADPDPR